MQVDYIVSVASALSVFFVASVEDLREREVSDILWIVLGAVAFAIAAYSVYSGYLQLPGLSYLLFLPPLYLFIDMFVDWEGLIGRAGMIVRYVVAAVFFIPAFALSVNDLGAIQATIVASITAWILLIMLLYKIDVIKGGADAKALITLSVLFPFYPATLFGPGQPLYSALTFPFWISVLMMGAIFSLIVPVYFFFRNAAKGNVRMPNMFLGYRKDLGKVTLTKEWLLEIPDDTGQPKRVRKLGSSDEEAALTRIRDLGWKSTWVSPKIPFIVPLTAGLLFVLLFGNPLLYL